MSDEPRLTPDLEAIREFSLSASSATDAASGTASFIVHDHENGDPLSRSDIINAAHQVSRVAVLAIQAMRGIVAMLDLPETRPREDGIAHRLEDSGNDYELCIHQLREALPKETR